MKKPSITLSLIPFVVLIAMMFLVVKFMGANAMDGASQMVLIVCAGLVIFLAMVFCRVPWQQIENAIGYKIVKSSTDATRDASVQQ